MLFSNKIVIRLLTLIAIFLLISCGVRLQDKDTIKLSARLVRVVSGQTIEVRIPQQDNFYYRVRIIGINVPKIEDKTLSKTLATQAKTELEELLTDNAISLELETDKTDRYNRVLAHVWQNNLLISEQLARKGFVLSDTKYPHKYSDRIFYAQEYARILNYGIWQN